MRLKEDRKSEDDDEGTDGTIRAHTEQHNVNAKTIDLLLISAAMRVDLSNGNRSAGNVHVLRRC